MPPPGRGFPPPEEGEANGLVVNHTVDPGKYFVVLIWLNSVCSSLNQIVSF